MSAKAAVEFEDGRVVLHDRVEAAVFQLGEEVPEDATCRGQLVTPLLYRYVERVIRNLFDLHALVRGREFVLALGVGGPVPTALERARRRTSLREAPGRAAEEQREHEQWE